MGTNLKWYDSNELDSTNTSYSFTSASSTLSNYLWDNNYTTKLTSSGSDDSTPEVWTMSFTSTITIDAIYLGNHNVKAGNVQYSINNGSSYADFSTAITLSGETASYNIYTFNSVSGITDIRFTMNTTQTVDAEKYCGQFRAFSLIYEMLQNPATDDMEEVENSRIHSLGDAGHDYIFFGNKYHNVFLFSDATDAEILQLKSLKERKKPTYVFPGGGDAAQTQYGWRVADMYYVNYVNLFAPKLKNNILGIGTMIEVELLEV